MAWYEKNMVFKDSMLNVDESAYESHSSDKDPTTLNEPDEGEVEHDPLNTLMMMKFHFQNCCLIQRFCRLKGLIMVMQIRTCHY
jgi:hypothetical protein